MRKNNNDTVETKRFTDRWAKREANASVHFGKIYEFSEIYKNPQVQLFSQRKQLGEEDMTARIKENMKKTAIFTAHRIYLHEGCPKSRDISMITTNQERNFNSMIAKAWNASLKEMEDERRMELFEVQRPQGTGRKNLLLLSRYAP